MGADSQVRDLASSYTDDLYLQLLVCKTYDTQ